MEHETVVREGKIFHQIRKARLFSLVGLGEKSTLSRFEHGDSSLRMETALPIFEKVHLSMDDFSDLLNEDRPSETKLLYQKVFDAFCTLNTEKLLVIQKEANKNNDVLLELGLQSLMNEPLIATDLRAKGYHPKPLTEAQEILVSEYIFGVDYWDSYNLFLLRCYASTLSKRMMDYVLGCLTKKSATFRHMPDRNKFLQSTLNYLIAKYTSEGDRHAAEEMFNKADIFTTENDLLNKVIRHYLKGYFDSQFDNAEAGAKKMEQAIIMLETLDDSSLSRLLTSYYGFRIVEESQETTEQAQEKAVS